jgi:hypothetical protein
VDTTNAEEIARGIEKELHLTPDQSAKFTSALVRAVALLLLLCLFVFL